MSSDDAHTLLSVRGEARLAVAPDQATVTCTVTNLSATPTEAAAAVSSILTVLTGELSALGGKPRAGDRSITTDLVGSVDVCSAGV